MSAEPDDAVFFPPLSAGERIRCTHPAPGLVVNTVYTVKANTGNQTPCVPDNIELVELDGTFPEIFFDRP